LISKARYGIKLRMTEKGSGGRMRVKGSWKGKAGGGGVRRYEVRGRVVQWGWGCIW